MPRPPLRHAALLLVALALFACSKPLVKVYGEQSEHDANEMILALRGRNIIASKVADKSGVSVMVQEQDFADAIRALQIAGLPHQKHATVMDLFPAGNMFTTPAEEAIRARFSLEQQISSDLTLIQGIRSAQVILALPDIAMRGPQQASSASVLLVYNDQLDPEGLVPRVKMFVRNSVPNLTDDHISVSMFRAHDETAGPPPGGDGVRGDGVRLDGKVADN